MRKRQAMLAALGLAVCAAAASAQSAPGYRVIVNRDNPVGSLKRKDLSAIFLGRTSVWPDGSRALPVDQSASSAVRDEFSEGVLGRKAHAIKNYWLQLVFAGRGVPPPEKASDQDVIAFVKANRGAVGYVSATTRSDAIGVLRIEP